MRKKINSKELAEMLNVSKRTLTRISSAGLLPPHDGFGPGGRWWFASGSALRRFIGEQKRPLRGR
ncbi:helix-turn-helix domain-containing protein [Citrobacter freundii]|nr:helix-turn-helix domain-containing protein [Salmonella enterica subsp. enterica serovar Braenderup]MBW9593885.1 helix-turn-helix domain-containing protein [Citrobacter freundii]HAH1156267.1 helix-turn-helix domain-containing protein [Escherichia coli]HAJ7538018.1 helix-turn-helix domain-containing protein [Escherichia coli]HAJ7551160.1 helix-turn-helix domain-containing protein [Escherichia coli]